MKRSCHTKNSSSLTGKVKPTTPSNNLNQAFAKISEIEKRIEQLKSKSIFYFKESEGCPKFITAEKNPGLGNLGYELEINNSYIPNINIKKIYNTDINTEINIEKIYQKSNYGYQELSNPESQTYLEKTTLLKNYLKDKEKKKEILGAINENKNGANDSTAIEDQTIKNILVEIQKCIDKAFEENEIKTQEDLLFYRGLITKIEGLLKSPVNKSKPEATNKPQKPKVQSTSKDSKQKDDNQKDSFSENNDKFCKFLSEKVLLNNCDSNVEALQPYNISNKPFIIEGNTFFLSKQQIKYLTEIKSLVLTKKSSEFKREPVIINGVPGSGKSYLTKLITEKSENLQRLLEQIDKKPIGQLKYEAKELNYCECYDYQAGNVAAKTDDKIKNIIDDKIKNATAGKKLFLMVDEWGVMYPPYATEYLKTIQQTNENIAIIGISANPEPIKALLDSKQNELSYGSNYRNSNIINYDIFKNKDNANINYNVNFNHIVDFTREINSSELLIDYINKNNSIILDQSYIICSYKLQNNQQENQNNYFLLCKKNGKNTTPITYNINNNASEVVNFAFNQDQLLSKLNNLTEDFCNFNLIASHSTARGADFNEIVKHIKKESITNEKHNYKIIDNQICSNPSSSANAIANIAQGLQRARLLKTEHLQPNGNFPNNHYIEIYRRELGGEVKKYEEEENIKNTVIQNNNFFGSIKNKDSISVGDLATLESKIKECEKIKEYQETKTKIAFIKSLKEKLPESFDEQESIKQLINKNKKKQEFSKYLYLAETSLALNPESCNYKTPKLETKENGTTTQKITKFFIEDFNEDFNQTGNYTIKATEIERYDPNANPIELVEEKIFKVENGNINQENKFVWSFKNIAIGTVAMAGVAGGIGYGIDCISTSSSAGASSGGSSTTAIPQINPFIQANGNALSSDLRSHLKPINYIENHYNVKNIAINHHQHSTSLIGKSNLSIGHLGATKTAHLSLASSTAGKIGFATKAGLLASTFTPFLAIAGIGAVGYLGYKTFNYFYNNEDKENFVQNNKKDLDKLNLYQKNNQEIFKENKKKPSVLLNPNNIEKLHHPTLKI